MGHLKKNRACLVYIILENFLSHPRTNRSYWMALIQLSSSGTLLNFNPEHKRAEAGCQPVTPGKEEREEIKKKKGVGRRREGKEEKMASVTFSDFDLSEDGLPTYVKS